jgi:hypothetical protein
MPLAARTVALLMLLGPFAALPAFANPAMPGVHSARSLPAYVILAFDDDVFGEGPDFGDRRDDDDARGPSEDRGYGDDDDHSDDDSAIAPNDDDDEGWDIDPLDRSERA